MKRKIFRNRNEKIETCLEKIHVFLATQSSFSEVSEWDNLHEVKLTGIENPFKFHSNFLEDFPHKFKN